MFWLKITYIISCLINLSHLIFFIFELRKYNNTYKSLIINDSVDEEYIKIFCKVTILLGFIPIMGACLTIIFIFLTFALIANKFIEYITNSK